MAKAKKDFESMIAELEEIVLQMEQGGLSLEDTLKKYSAGQELISACRTKLAAAAQALAPTPAEEEAHE